MLQSMGLQRVGHNLATKQHTKEYYSAIKKNELTSFAATWMEQEVIILSEISQEEKDQYHMALLICGI